MFLAVYLCGFGFFAVEVMTYVVMRCQKHQDQYTSWDAKSIVMLLSDSAGSSGIPVGDDQFFPSAAKIRLKMLVHIAISTHSLQSSNS